MAPHFPIRTKYLVLTMVYETLYVICPLICITFLILSTTFPFLHMVLDTLTYSLLLAYSRNTPVSRPLCLVFPLLGISFPRYPMIYSLTCKLFLKCHILGKPYPYYETTSFKIVALFIHSASWCLLLCFCSSSISFNIIWPTMYFTYFFTVPSHKNVSSMKARMCLSCSLLYPSNQTQSLTQRSSINIAERMKQAAQYIQKLYIVQYHWTIMWEREKNRRWRPVHKEFTLDILDFTNYLDILLKGGFWCSRSEVGPDNQHF